LQVHHTTKKNPFFENKVYFEEWTDKH